MPNGTAVAMPNTFNNSDQIIDHDQYMLTQEHDMALAYELYDHENIKRIKRKRIRDKRVR